MLTLYFISVVIMALIIGPLTYLFVTGSEPFTALDIGMILLMSFMWPIVVPVLFVGFAFYVVLKILAVWINKLFRLG